MREAAHKDARSSARSVNNLAEEQPAVASTSVAGRPRIAIAEALRQQWFEIWYQPKIDLKRKCLAGAEALARIRHPKLGVLPPGSFEPEVDENSVCELAEYAFLAALCDWSMFEDAGFNLYLAVNVPVGVLLKLPVAELVREHRPKSEHWPGLIVEVTEDQIVRDIALAREIAAQLQVSGIRIAIDNIGAGYSSFSSLRVLPFAELKLDRTFVEGCAADATKAAICQTTVDLAHRFGSAAVAEGLKTQPDLQALIAMGCDFGQGALIAPPMPKERFLELLRQRANKRASPREAMQAAAKPIGRVA